MGGQAGHTAKEGSTGSDKTLQVAQEGMKPAGSTHTQSLAVSLIASLQG